MSKFVLSVAVGLCLTASPSFAQYVGPDAGQKVAFMGDSITHYGESPTGYVSLVADALEATGKKITVIPAAVSSDTSRDMLARMQKNVLAKKPNWMTLSCGVNDVFHGAKGCTLDEYKQNITSIVDQATAAGIKVVILTPTMVREVQANDVNQKLIPYNQFLHSLADKKHLLIADLNADMQAELAAQKAANPKLTGYILTKDGIHMNGLGNEMMAAGVLKAFGLTDAQIASAREKWLDLPGGTSMGVQIAVTVRQYLQLRSQAVAQGKSVEDFLAPDLSRAAQTESSASAPNTPPKP